MTDTLDFNDIEWKPLEDEKLSYNAMSKKYGRAEFGFCIVRNKQGIITQIFIHAIQQDREDKFWKVEPVIETKSFAFNSFTHKGVDRPWAWQYSWCEDHMALNVRVYVPTGTDHIRVEESSVTGISFYFQKS